MAAQGTGADRGIGYTVGIGLIAVGGALAMYLNPGSPIAGWGFAVAMLAGALAVIAAQVYA